MTHSNSRRSALLAGLFCLACAAAWPAWAQAPASPVVAERDGAGQTLQDLYQAAVKD